MLGRDEFVNACRLTLKSGPSSWFFIELELLYTRSGSGNYSDLCIITRHLQVYSYLQRGVDGFPARTLEGAKTSSYHNLPSQAPELFRQDDLSALESGSSGTLERWCLNKIQGCCDALYIKPNSSITGFQPLFPQCNHRSAAGSIYTPLVYTFWVGCVVVPVVGQVD